VTIDIATIKQSQQRTWGSGDYRVIGNPLMIMAEQLCERVRVLPHHRVLDIATGTGNTALAAAHRNTRDVTGIDFAAQLLETARKRAEAEGSVVTFELGDAEELPYPDDSFDIVLSTLGVMFSPDQQQAANEIVRVCWPGGRVGLTNWTPSGFVGQMLKTVGSYAPPPPGVQSPVLWGTEERLRELFGDRLDLEIEERDFVFRFHSADHFVEVFSNFYGPIVTALSRIDEGKRESLKGDLKAVATSFGHRVEESFEIPSSYLEVVGMKR
jgi:SAM-dependent methyltransferase